MLSISKSVARSCCLYISRFCCSSGYCVPSFFIGMGRRGKRGTPVQPSGPWMQASLQRSEQHRAIRQDAATGVPENLPVQLGTCSRRASASGEPVAPDEQPEYRTTEGVMAMVHRGGQEGLRPSGFSPDRHTVYICGRPVQVLGKSHESLTMTPQHILNLSIRPAPLCGNILTWSFPYHAQFHVRTPPPIRYWTLRSSTNSTAFKEITFQGKDNILPQRGMS